MLSRLSLSPTPTPRRGLLACTAVAALSVMLGCGGDPAEPSTHSQQQVEQHEGVPALPEPLAKAVSANQAIISWCFETKAGLEPCGCVAGMHGGLLRRASLLARTSPEAVLSCEGGGWSGGAADYQLTKTRYYLDGLALAQIDVLGVGASEVRLGSTHLSDLLAHAASAKLPVVCANLSADNATPLTLSALHRVTAAGQRFAVTSVVPASASGAGLTVSDPAEALLALTAKLQGDPLVVLADMDEAGLRALATAVPGIAVVIGGAVHDPSPAPIAVGPTRVVFAGNQGKVLAHWVYGAPSCTPELINDQIADHSAIRALVTSYQEALGAMDLQIDERIGGMTSLAGSGGASYVGSASCAACHSGAHATWQNSRHAHALDTLRERNYHRDPECLRCHVTGLATPSGYSRKGANPALGMVSCESCHGQGSTHVAERSAGKQASGSLVPVTQASCLRCHDDDNSPHFDYTTYWPRIVHDAN
ncbi:MAG: multiheme c-type cytochrome [Planctomycetota bacterium]|nr:multiheme c-type cytochrome [Planctomycetota bacterium]